MDGSSGGIRVRRRTKGMAGPGYRLLEPLERRRVYPLGLYHGLTVTGAGRCFRPCPPAMWGRTGSAMAAAQCPGSGQVRHFQWLLNLPATAVTESSLQTCHKPNPQREERRSFIPKPAPNRAGTPELSKRAPTKLSLRSSYGTAAWGGA